MHISTRISALAVVFVALGGSARADTSTESSGTLTRGHSVVDYGDLHIETERDATIMLHRIERAAKKACGGHPTFSAFTGSLDRTFQECRDGAIRRTVQQLGAPMVTRVYSEAMRREFSRRCCLLQRRTQP